MYVYPFEKLEAWTEAKKLSLEVYKLTIKFPGDEKFGMVDQMRRASVSVCCNIAEGSARRTKKDQAHFYTMAYSSLMELLNLITISEELKYLSLVNYHAMRSQIEIVSKKLYALRSSVINQS